MNPILPVQHFVPDVEARQWESGGPMYIYGSYDIGGNTTYCSYEYRVFSSMDLINWTDHGVSFKSTGEDTSVPWSHSPLYAPDCICRNGTYYLYFCLADNSEGVATSNRPWGPFTNAVPVKGANGDAIDPAVFIDDDGQAYYYWGQFKARGARLNADMSSIDPETLNTELINEEEHGFHEGASMRKRNGIYYLVYTDISRGKATCISYATSESPLGPFKKGGVIIDNIGCDPGTWNNHGSIAEFNEKWYIFYHRSSQGTNVNRRVCVEPIIFGDDGSIAEVEMTTQGVSGPLDPFKGVDAYRACLLSDRPHTGADSCCDSNETYELLTRIEDKSWAAYKYFDFSKPIGSFEVIAASSTYGGKIEVRLDSVDGKLLGVCDIKATGGWNKWESFACPVENASGIHAVYLVFRGNCWGRLFNVKSFKFTP